MNSCSFLRRWRIGSARRTRLVSFANQRVVCFRLAIHFNRLGLPFDITVAALKEWARKNQPTNGKRRITNREVHDQADSAYKKAYRGFGCDEAAVRQFCSPDCPLCRHRFPEPAEVYDEQSLIQDHCLCRSALGPPPPAVAPTIRIDISARRNDGQGQSRCWVRSGPTSAFAGETMTGRLNRRRQTSNQGAVFRQHRVSTIVSKTVRGIRHTAKRERNHSSSIGHAGPRGIESGVP